MVRLIAVALAVLTSVASAAAQTAQTFSADSVRESVSPTAIKPGPTVATNVRTVLDAIDQGCLEITLVRKSVVVAIPCRLPGGGFDHSFRLALTVDQERAHLEKGYKSRWIKSPKIIAKIFGDGNNPYRERVKAGGLEADRYDWGDKHVPNYIRDLMKRDALVEQAGGLTAPPYYWKLDVDYGYGIRNFFNQELPHLIMRKSTNQKTIAAILEQRKLAAGEAK